MCNGISTELDGIDLGDARLNRRSQHLIEALSANPEASINAACDGWADTLAAYRFFDNQAVTPEAILKPHIEATKQRIKSHKVCLSLQDTTELDFTSHPPEDTLCLDHENRFGLYDHTQLAVTPEGVPLGVVGVEYFDRQAETLGKSQERRNWPIEEKESFRWLTGYRQACELARECPETQIVSIADREADIYDVLLEADGDAGLADYIIRSKVVRCTLERDVEAGDAVYHKVRETVAASGLRGTQTIQLNTTPKREAREACLEIRAMKIAVKPPHARSSLASITVNVVLAEEIGGPNDGTDVSWLLITSLPVETLEDIFLILDYYVARWSIEVYFRIFKTGCKVEEIQLETRARIKNCLAMYKITAWRAMYLTHLNRQNPEVPCSTVFAASEWMAVWLVVKKTEVPKSPPTLGQFMRLLTRLGGYNNRKTERPPGPQPVWVGIRRMTDFAIAWIAFNNQ